MTRRRRVQARNKRQKASQNRKVPPLEPARRADADQLSHEQSEIEAGRMEQQALADVGVAAEVHAAHPARPIEMGKGPFQPLPAKAQQA